jgi:hypothetical protein
MGAADPTRNTPGEPGARFDVFPRKAAGRSHFAGRQTLATADDLEAFVRGAGPEDSFTYCEAPELLVGETSIRVTELAAEGLVRPHRRRREGGGWEFYIVRSRKGLPAAADPARSALADKPTDLIFRALKRAANFDRPCPTDTELARAAGLNTRDQAQWRVRKLVEAGLIESQLVYDGGIPTRVVKIEDSRHAGSAGGKTTALPKKWAAMRNAALRDASGQAERELRAADQADMDRLRRAGL